MTALFVQSGRSGCRSYSTKDEVKKVIDHMNGVPRLMAILLYGGGLRLMECCRLRVKDIDFSQNEILVRAGKGNKDRHTMLANNNPGITHSASSNCQVATRRISKIGLGRVSLPNALDRKYPNAGKEWGWQWVFPATSHLSTASPGKNAGTISMSLYLQRAFQRGAAESWRFQTMPAATRCAIHLPRTYWRMATISEQFKNYWGTMM